MTPDAGESRKLFALDEHSGFVRAEWSPDGQRLACYKHHEAGDKSGNSIESRDLKGGPATTLIPDPNRGVGLLLVGRLANHLLIGGAGPPF